MSFVAWILLAATVQNAAFSSEHAELLVEPTELTLRIGESAKLEVHGEGCGTAKTLDRRVLFLPLHGQFWKPRGAGLGASISFACDPTGPSPHRGRANIASWSRVPERTRTPAEWDAEAFLQKEIPLDGAPSSHRQSRVRGRSRPFLRANECTCDGRGVDRRGGTDVSQGTSAAELTSPRSGYFFASDSMGTLHLLKRGFDATLSASAGGKTAELAFEIVDNPTASLKLETASPVARTGDVVRFEAKAKGTVRETRSRTFRSFSASSGGRMRLQAEGPSSGAHPTGWATWALRRRLAGRIYDRRHFRHPRGAANLSPSFLGKRSVRSSSWGMDESATARHPTSGCGKERMAGDYAITGTHRAGRPTLISGTWTDPGNLVIIDTVHVDARTVNGRQDFGRWAALPSSAAREPPIDENGNRRARRVRAPGRRFGSCPRYDDELTGGVPQYLRSR